MFPATLQQHIENLLEQEFPDVFVVDMHLSQGMRPVLSLKIDKDNGITLEACMKVSRKVGAMIEELDLISSAYNLEVSSPGVGSPLKVRRQYVSNVGRYLAVRTTGGSDLRGKLLEANEESILLEPLASGKNRKKPKAGEAEEQGSLRIPFDQIHTAKVIIVS